MTFLNTIIFIFFHGRIFGITMISWSKKMMPWSRICQFCGKNVCTNSYYTHRGSRFDWCVGLSYSIQKMRESSPRKTCSPICIVLRTMSHCQCLNAAESYVSVGICDVSQLTARSSIFWAVNQCKCNLCAGA